MKFRNIALALGAFSLAASPAIAEGAFDRAIAPIEGESQMEGGGGSTLFLVLGAAAVIAGYQAVNPRPEAELALLHNLIAMRLCVSASVAAHNQTLEPENEYLQVSAQPAWHCLLYTSPSPRDA